MILGELWAWGSSWHWLSWGWTNSAAYNFNSSEWGGAIWHAAELFGLYLLLKPLYRKVIHHYECDEHACTRIGHRIEGTPYRACHEHHPGRVHEPGEAITVKHLKEAHQIANRPIGEP